MKRKTILVIGLMISLGILLTPLNKLTSASTDEKIPTSVTKTYGLQKDGSFHHGVDIAVPPGKFLITNRNATVIKAGNDKIYGLVVILDIGNNTQILYGHNSKLLVKERDNVVIGQPIAVSGSSGRSTGSHVHIEVRQNGKTINPYDYLNGQK